MKTCPVCGAGAFDDAEVCFGCLHRYEGHALKREDTSLISQGAVALSEKLVEVQPCDGVRPRVANTVQSGVVSTVDEVREDAGWVVRFEFPGFAATSTRKLEVEGERAHEGLAATAESCALLKRGCAPKGAASCDMVVRLQPIIASPKQEERRRGKPARGNHVRASCNGDVVGAALPGLV